LKDEVIGISPDATEEDSSDISNWRRILLFPTESEEDVKLNNSKISEAPVFVKALELPLIVTSVIVQSFVGNLFMNI
jgi:hypothetical protein